MSKLITLIAAAAVSVALAAPALAREGRHEHEFHDRDGERHRDGFRGGIFFYDPAFAYTYPSADFYYFCPPANAYYPAIPSCPVPWQLVPAR